MSAQPHAEMQELLDLLLPRRPYLRPGEVADALRMDLKTIDVMFGRTDTNPSGPKLHGFDFTAKGQRPHKRIERASVILLLIERSNYTPAEARARLREVIARLPRGEIAHLYADLGAMLRTS